jgi:hypothetical protein
MEKIVYLNMRFFILEGSRAKDQRKKRKEMEVTCS